MQTAKILLLPLLVPLALPPALPSGLQDPVRVPGTQVRLVPPPDFSPSAQFPGFAHPDTGSSIMITEIPGPFEEVTRGFTDAGLKRQGMKGLSRRSEKMGEHSGLLLEVEQATQGLVVRKWLRIFGSETNTVLVMSTCFEEFVDAHHELLREAVLSSEWDLGRDVDPYEGLGFELGYEGGLELFNRLGNQLTYTADGENDEQGTGKAMFIVGPSLGSIDPDRREAFARERLLAHPFDGIVPRGQEPIELDGLQGFASTATVKDRGRTPCLLYQVILFEGGAYWLMVASVARKDSESYLPCFERMARSFGRTWKTHLCTEGRVRVDAPASWSVVDLNDVAELQIGNPTADCYLIVLTEPKTDFEDMDHEAHSDLTRASLFADDPDHEESEPKRLEIAGRKAIQYTLRALVGETRIVYLHTTVDGAEHYHQVLAWTLESAFDDARSELETIVASLEELR